MNRIVLTWVMAVAAISIGFTQSDVSSAILDYTNQKMGKKVKRGECWDLVSEALDYANADWDPPTGFGKRLDLEANEVQPGDIIEFKNVRIVTPDRQTLEAPQHYGVIMEVLDNKKYIIGHQNFNNKRKVMLTEFDLNYMKKGKVAIYRPS